MCSAVCREPREPGSSVLQPSPPPLPVLLSLSLGLGQSSGQASSSHNWIFPLLSSTQEDLLEWFSVLFCFATIKPDCFIIL